MQVVPAFDDALAGLMTTLRQAPHVASLLTASTEGLEWFAERTGLSWGVTPRPLFWYRPADLHVVEFVLFHAFVLVLFFMSRNFLSRYMSNPKSFHQIIQLDAFDRMVGAILFACWMSQVVLKAIRPNALIQMWWLIMPCHLITLAWCHILLNGDLHAELPSLTDTDGNAKSMTTQLAAKRSLLVRMKASDQCRWIATLIATYHWGPAGAAAIPDWTDHQYRIEGFIFVLHHGLLVLLPFYFAAKFGFLSASLDFFLHSTWIATWVNVGPYTVASYLTGLNVNYHLCPPPKLLKMGFFQSIYYRFYVVLALIVLSLLCRFGISFVGWFLIRLPVQWVWRKARRSERIEGKRKTA